MLHQEAQDTIHPTPILLRKHIAVNIDLGKSKRGLTNGSLNPKFSEKIGGKSFLGNWGFSGQIGASFSTEEEQKLPPFLALLAPFGPPFAKPLFGFPD